MGMLSNSGGLGTSESDISVVFYNSVNTFAYDLSAYLANILSPFTGNSNFTVTNSANFVSTISSKTIPDSEM